MPEPRPGIVHDARYAFTVSTTNAPDAGVVEQIYAACDDATATSEEGAFAIAFDRQAASLDEATRSALGQLTTLDVAVTAATRDAEPLAVLR